MSHMVMTIPTTEKVPMQDVTNPHVCKDIPLSIEEVVCDIQQDDLQHIEVKSTLVTNNYVMEHGDVANALSTHVVGAASGGGIYLWAMKLLLGMR